jgi:transcriptional regulator with PAS, ATPase and Fis domain
MDNKKEQDAFFEFFEKEFPKEGPDIDNTLPFELAYIEKKRIKLALEQCHNHTQAAKQLGIGRTNLLAKLKKYGISKYS